MPPESIETLISDMMQKNLLGLTALSQQWTDKQNNYLKRIEWELMQFNSHWKQVNGNIAAIRHEEAILLTDNSSSHLIPELLGPLNMIAYSLKMFENFMLAAISEETAQYLHHLRLGEKILEAKFTELADAYKNTNLLIAKSRLSGGLELDASALIDSLLDNTIELKLLSHDWEKNERGYLEELHAALLRLNHYWQVLDADTPEDVFLINHSSSLISNLIALLDYDYKETNGKAYLQKMLSSAALFEAKVSYLLTKIIA